MKHLITIEHIKSFRPISKELSNERMLPYIEEAQLNDLRPLLGDTLFWDFLNKFDNTVDALYADYQKLLNGDSYTPSGSPASVTFLGVIPCLSYYALARYFENNSIHAVRYGIVQKVNDNLSEQVSPQVLAAAIESIRAVAFGYQSQVINYLKNKTSIFTLYKYVNQSDNINDSGVKFFDV